MGMTITDTGKNLSILINTHTAEDWKAFATWYSVYKNLPEAKVVIVCNRNQRIEFQYFQWAKRLNIPHFYQKVSDPITTKIKALYAALDKELISGTILCLDAAVIISEPLNETLLGLLNKKDYELLLDEKVWVSNNLTKSKMIDIWDNYGLTGDFGVKTLNYKVCVDAKEGSEGANVVSFEKGCGKWIDTMKGCPFSSAAGMAEEGMNVNELRIIELWKKMVPLYSVVL